VSRYRFIAAEEAQYSVALLCRILGVARSGYYAWQQRQPAARTRANLALTERIRAIHRDSRQTYGATRVRAELAATGLSVSRKRVARLMRLAELVGRGPHRFRRTTVADPTSRVPDLVRRDFRPGGLNRLWVADITYVRTAEGWALAEHLRTELATDALRMALSHRHPPAGLIHHSDRGCQYTATAYGELLRAQQVVQSVGLPGTCWDNAVAESFFATLKTELLYRHSWPTRRHAQTAIFEFIEVFYNRHRRHSTLGYVSPAEFEARYSPAATAA
jgi:transposase InsO family protein